MQCPFCKPHVEDLPIVGRNEHCLSIDVADEILAGSRIIVPRQHRATPFEMTEAEITATFELLRAAKLEIDSAMSPDGYNIGWNSGAIAGQEVFHAHLHVVPRFRDEPLAGMGIRYWLKQENNRRPNQ
ncbi:MAG: HIT family protein [Chloroflexota bacterium]|nr:HIT family protein [Chloroflexota bacterium]MDE2970360.1 HIT family protein [Chloroflexota bacterium]